MAALSIRRGSFQGLVDGEGFGAILGPPFAPQSFSQWFPEEQQGDHRKLRKLGPLNSFASLIPNGPCDSHFTLSLLAFPSQMPCSPRLGWELLTLGGVPRCDSVGDLLEGSSCWAGERVQSPPPHALPCPMGLYKCWELGGG